MLPHKEANECKYKGETLKSVQIGLDLLAYSTFSIYMCFSWLCHFMKVMDIEFVLVSRSFNPPAD